MLKIKKSISYNGHIQNHFLKGYIDIQARLNLQTYLQAFGFQNIQSGSYWQKGDDAPSTYELSSLLAMHAPQLSGFLKKMNWSAHEVLNPWREDPWPRKVQTSYRHYGFGP